jgi:hypothetical protein
MPSIAIETLPPLVSVAAAAKAMNRDHRTMKRWVGDVEGLGVTIGGRLFIRTAILKELAEGT